MWTHTQSHSGEVFSCTDCDKSFITNSYLQQHIKGAHGKGWKALCGKYCQWPHLRRKHQEDCERCNQIKKERKNKPDNPRPFKQRKLTVLKNTAT